MENKASERGVIEAAKEEGEAGGIEKGEYRKAINTAQIMLANGEAIEKIKEYTGLSEEEIQKLKAKTTK